jgi:predicted TIM-barrel fold metal-dependent hydrolase
MCIAQVFADRAFAHLETIPMNFPVPRPVKIGIPAGATDCHMHVFGNADRYPLSPNRNYTPPPALLDHYRKVAAALNLTRTVVVQPSAYGSDNSCILDTVAEIGISARAVVGIDLSISDEELNHLHARGARGVRVNAASRGLRDTDEIANLITNTAKRITRLGWHVQVFTDLAVIEKLAGCLRSLPVPIVFDHMGYAKAAQGLTQPGLAALCDLLAGDRCWVKLSGAYRVSVQEPGFADAETIIRALIAANADRAVWGTDWPHTGGHGHAASTVAPPLTYRSLDTAALLEQLVACAGHAAVVTKILVDNPARLYGF